MPFFQRIRIAPRFRICARTIVFMMLAELAVSNLCAQTAAQQRVYGSASVTTSTSVLPGFAKDSTTGALTALAGAPLADKLEGGLVAIDGPGKFLFVLNPVSDSISMYRIDGSNGVLTAVGNAGGGSDLGRAIAIDPQCRFFFDGWEQSQGFVWIAK